MISRLIDMQIPSNYVNTKSHIVPKDKYTILDYASSFIFGMSESQRNRFKKMLENNINCGMSIADNYGVNYDSFILEVKKQLGIN